MEKANGTMEKKYGRIRKSMEIPSKKKKKHGRFSKSMNFDLHWKKQW